MRESTFNWATVTAVAPLRIRLDGDTVELPFAPESLIDPDALAAADRVRCEISNRRVIILGRAGGLVLPSPPALAVADLDALPNPASIDEGSRLHVDALDVDFQVVDGGWVQRGVASVASTSARDTEYAKASGAYLLAGVEVLVTADSTTYRRVGSNWVPWRKPWSAFTPTFTQVTIGNGTLSSAYCIVDGEVHVRGKLVFGSTTTVTGNQARMTWPETPHASILSEDHVIGEGRYRDVSASDVFYMSLSIYQADLSTVHFRRFAQTGSYTSAAIGRLEGWNSSSPAPTGTGDLVTWEYRYPIANAY